MSLNGEYSTNSNSNFPVLANGETVLWHGKPQKKGFIATKSLAMAPIAIVWLIFDLGFIGLSIGEAGVFGIGLFFFMLLHMMPVWIWLGNIITASKRWRNTAYYVTDKRIIIQGGFLAINEKSVFYKDISNVQMKIGLLDKIFGTGDLIFDDGTAVTSNRRVAVNGVNVQQGGSIMEDLENPREVYNYVQKVVLDMQTDVEYPNALRPPENPGYNTKYKN